MRLVNQYPSLKATAGSTLAAIARFDVSAIDILTVDLDNNGAALNAFEVRARGVGPSQRAHMAYKATWTDVDGHVLDFTTAPDALASGASTQLQINVAALESIELWASTGTSTVIDINAGGYAE